LASRNQTDLENLSMPESTPPSAPPPRKKPGPVRWVIAIVLVVLAAWAGWHTYRVFRQRGVVAHIDDLGGVVTYDYDYYDPDDRETKPPPKSAIANVLGDDYTQNVVEVNLSSRGEPLTDEDLERVSSLGEMRKLSISSGGEITDAGLKHIAQMPKLEWLVLSKFDNVTDAGLAVLENLPALRKLELHSLPKITDKGLEHLAKLEDLRELRITTSSIDGSGFQHINAPGLRVIETAVCQVNDEALQHLTGAKSLEELSVMQNQIKGPGLSQLKGLTSLTTLRLAENPLDPSTAVPNLKELTSLELLNLLGTKVDREAGKELAQALPKCNITIDDGSYDPEVGEWAYTTAPQE
jgi:hypothetical protein